MTTTIGIDPGASGAIVFLEDGVKPRVLKLKNATPREMLEFALERTTTGAVPDFAVVEKVGAMPKQGVASTFKFGRSFGMCEMALAATSVPYELVAPGVWQRTMGCLSKGDKNVTKAKAAQLFPGVKVTHAIADALLLAEYARRLFVLRSAEASR